MSISTSTRPLARFSLALLSLGLLALLLLASPLQAQAKSPKCPSGSHTVHAPTTCTKPAHGSAVHHHTSKHHHHATHAVHKAERTSKPIAAAPLTPALCEDASSAVPAGGSFTCADGSEPACEDGTTPVTHGAALLCPLATDEEGSSSNEQDCEAEGGCSFDSEGALGDEATCTSCEAPDSAEPSAESED